MAYTQLEFFLWCMAAGGIAGMLYDLLRISRKLINTPNAAVIAEDIVFLVTAAALSFYVAFVKNSSELRWYQFFGNLAGFALYRVSVKNAFVNLGIKIINILTKIFVLAVKIVLFPVVLLYKIFKKPFMIVVWYVQKTTVRVRKKANVRKEKMQKSWKITKNALFRRKK